MTTTVAPLLASSSSSSSNNNDHSYTYDDNKPNNNNNRSNNSKTANTRKTPATTTTTAKPQPQPQHSARRRPLQLQNLRALLILALLMGQLHELVRPGDSGDGAGLALAAPTPPAAAAAAGSPARRRTQRTRLQKRYDHSINSKDRFHRELNSSVLDWSNSCGGNWTGPDHGLRHMPIQNRCAKHKKVLRTLQNKTGQELKHLRDENKFRVVEHSMMAPAAASNRAIDTSDVHGVWKLQSDKYTFLPRLNASAQQLPLRRAHTDMQFYVAAFSYMRHAQLHWDYENLQRQSVLSAELMRLRTSSRLVLCFIEEAINGTNRLYAGRHKRVKTLGHIKTLQRDRMEQLLANFETPLVALHRQAVMAARNEPVEQPPSAVQFLDARFLKYHYLRYLKQMTQLLAKQRKRNCESPTNRRSSRAKTRQRPRTGPRPQPSH